MHTATSNFAPQPTLAFYATTAAPVAAAATASRSAVPSIAASPVERAIGVAVAAAVGAIGVAVLWHRGQQQRGTNGAPPASKLHVAAADNGGGGVAPLSTPSTDEAAPSATWGIISPMAATPTVARAFQTEAASAASFGGDGGDAAATMSHSTRQLGWQAVDTPTSPV